MGCVLVSTSYTSHIKYGSPITLSPVTLRTLTSHPRLNISWGIPTRNVFLMMEQLQQLQGKPLSNEHHRRQRDIGLNNRLFSTVCGSGCVLVIVVIYETDWGRCVAEIERWTANSSCLITVISGNYRICCIYRIKLNCYSSKGLFNSCTIYENGTIQMVFALISTRQNSSV